MKELGVFITNINETIPNPTAMKIIYDSEKNRFNLHLGIIKNNLFIPNNKWIEERISQLKLLTDFAFDISICSNIEEIPPILKKHKNIILLIKYQNTKNENKTKIKDIKTKHNKFKTKEATTNFGELMKKKGIIK